MLVVVVLFSSLEVFTFPGYFFLATGTPPRLLRPVKASTGSEFYPGYFRLLYFCQAFLPQFYCERYRFEWAFFIHRRFFNLRSFTDIFGTFCNSNVGRNTPPRILLCTCPHRVVSSGWRMDLNYSYCSYKAIDLSTVLASHVV